MNALSRRGACPSLAAPMPTGDGLLARLNPADGRLSPQALAGLCRAASRHGNDIVEVTQRGSVQIRGLTAQSARLLADDIDALGIAVRTGVPVETSPLAGLDPDETADPRPLAEAIRTSVANAGLAHRLGPKVSVIVDGGGRIDMGALIADVRLTAIRHERETRWHLAIGGTAATVRPVGLYAGTDAVAAVVAMLEAIAKLGREGRGRDIETGPIPTRSLTPTTHAALPLGTLPLRDGTFALGIALPFGSMPAGTLVTLAEAAIAAGAADIRPAPGHTLLLCGLGEDACRRLREAAAALGFVTNAADPRLHIAACPGQPACASGRIATRDIATRIAAAAPGLLDGSFTLHISGCAKGCAHPGMAALTLAGGERGAGLVVDGPATALAPGSASRADGARGLAAVAALVGTSRRPAETAAACLARLGAAAIEIAYRQD